LDVLDEVFFKIVDHLEVDFHVLVGGKGEFAEQRIEILDEIAEDGDFGLLLDEGDGVSDEPLLGVDAGDALIDEGEAVSCISYNLTREKMDSFDFSTACRMFCTLASSSAAV
jgi:hypothetical protein